jgi:pimeloyl-ACP methyl ester carboxylesterase
VTEVFREEYYRSGDGLTLYSRIYEAAIHDGASVLCLHGLTRNCRDFEDLAPHLATRFQIVAPDLRGRGRSARDPNMHNYNVQTYLADMLALLDSLGATRVAVIGTSLGGILAMLLAATHPERVAGIVLNDVGAEIDPAGVARIMSYAGCLTAVQSWAEAAAQAQAVYGAAWPDLDALRWQALARRAYREDASGVPQLDVDPMIGEALRRGPGTPVDLRPLWAALQNVPTLAIRGARSDILGAEVFNRMKREKPNLEQLTVSNRGHAPLLDEPECLPAIDRFLARLDFRPSTARKA